MTHKGYEFIDSLDSLKYNKYCPITGKKITNKDCEDRNVILLDCNHAFHYNSFMLSYVNLNKHILSYRKCPYCMSDISKIPFKFTKNIFRD